MSKCVAFWKKDLNPITMTKNEEIHALNLSQEDILYRNHKIKQQNEKS